MSVTDLGSSPPTVDNIGPVEPLTAITPVPSDDVVIGSRDPLPDTNPLPAGNAGPLTWDTLSEIDHPTIAEDTDDELSKYTSASGGGNPASANPVGGNIGTLLPLGTNPDGSHFFSGVRNVDATLIGSKWGTTNLTYSFPTSGSNYSGAGYDPNNVSVYTLIWVRSNRRPRARRLRSYRLCRV